MEQLRVTCLARHYEGKRRNHNEFIVGTCSIPVDRLPEDGHVEQWYQLKHPTDVKATLKAAVKLRLHLVVNAGTDAFAAAASPISTLNVAPSPAKPASTSNTMKPATASGNSSGGGDGCDT